MGNKNKPKKIKKSYEETHKTKDERQSEIKNLLLQLSELGINAQTPGMLQFLQQSKLFIEDGTYWQGRIPLKGTHRILCGFLTNKKGIVSDITLKYVKDED